MKVNFITEITGFYRFIQTRQLSSNAQLLWFMLFCLWNSAGFPDWLQVDMKRMALMIQANSRSTAERARNELIAAGRIICVRGKSRTPNCYQFVLFASQRSAQPDASTSADQINHHSGHHSGHQVAHQKLAEKCHQTANFQIGAAQAGDQSEDHLRHQTAHQPLHLYKLNNPKLNNIKANHKEKSAYGQFGNVFLTASEMELLKADFPDSWEDWIRRLDLGKESKGYVYSSDYAAIHSWQQKEDQQASDQAFQELLDEWELFSG